MAGEGRSGALWRKEFEGLVRDDARQRRRRGGAGSTRLPSAHPDGGRNRGVGERDKRDREEAEAARVRANSALERKAQLYDRLAGGEGEDDDELYGVDFLKKSCGAGEEAGTCSAAPPEATRANASSDEAPAARGAARASVLRARRAQLKEQRRKRLKAKHFEKITGRSQ